MPSCSRITELIILHFGLFILLVRTLDSRDVRPQKETYLPDYNFYHNLSYIETHLEEIVQRNAGYLKIDNTYISKESRPQLLLKVTNFTDGRKHVSSEDVNLTPSKLRILLSYGEHAREFLPIESLFHLLLNLTSGLSAPEDDPAHQFSKNIFSKIELFIVVMLNPDGRRYVEERGNYCWRGTSGGVDLNRNFEWNFGDKGSSSNIKDEEYRGSYPFSEPESRILLDLTAKYSFDCFVSLHSGIRQIYVPFADSHSKSIHKKPENLQAMLDLADKMSHSTVNSYAYGLAYQLNQYTADGTIFDYMAGKRKIPFSFAIELWGNGAHKGASCFDLFNPPNHELQTAVKEIHPLYVTLFNYLSEWKREKNAVQDPVLDAPSLSFGYALLALVVLLTACVAFHNRLPASLRVYQRRRVVSLRALSSTFSLVKN